MTPRKPDGRFTREDRKEGLNISISNFTIQKYLFSLLYSQGINWLKKQIEKTEILIIFNTSRFICNDSTPGFAPFANSIASPIGKHY